MTDFKPVIRAIVQAMVRKYLHPKVLLKKFGPRLLKRIIDPRKLLKKLMMWIMKKIFNPRKMLKFFGRKLLREKLVPQLKRKAMEALTFWVTEKLEIMATRLV